jgi:DNA-binding NarL/FixJ family response regulator
MSLERKLILSVFLVLMASLLVGAALTYEHAARKVRTKMDAALAVSRRIVQNAFDDTGEPANPERRLARVIADFKQALSNRELDIMRLLAQGQTLSEIAAQLGVSYKTIANSCTGIKDKLHVELAGDLIRLAIEMHAG